LRRWPSGARCKPTSDAGEPFNIWNRYSAASALPPLKAGASMSRERLTFTVGSFETPEGSTV
jgi:hypothetical protein